MGAMKGLIFLTIWWAVAGLVPASEVQGGLVAKHDQLPSQRQVHKIALRRLHQLNAFRIRGAANGLSASFPLRGRSALSLPVCEWDATVTDTTTAKCDISKEYTITALRGVYGPMKDLVVCDAATDKTSCKALPNSCVWLGEEGSCQSKEFVNTIIQCLPDDTPFRNITAKVLLCEVRGDSQAECTGVTFPNCTWNGAAEQCSYIVTQEDLAALQGESGATVESAASPSTDPVDIDFPTPKSCAADYECSIRRYGVKGATESSYNPVCSFIQEGDSCDATNMTACEATMSSLGTPSCMWNAVYNTCSIKGAYIAAILFPGNLDKATALGDQADACQQKATESECSGTTVEVTDKVKVVRAKVTFAGADYDNITKSSEARAAFEADFKKAIAKSAAVVDEWVIINGLSKGSVIADFKVIFPPDFDAQSTSFSNKLTTNTSAIFINTSLQSYDPQPAQDVATSASVSVQDAEKSSARLSAAQGSALAAAAVVVAAWLLAY